MPDFKNLGLFPQVQMAESNLYPPLSFCTNTSHTDTPVNPTQNRINGELPAHMTRQFLNALELFSS